MAVGVSRGSARAEDRVRREVLGQSGASRPAPLALRLVRRLVPLRWRERWRLWRAPLLEDRRVLEQVIIPHFLSDPGIRSVLFVGCAWYTQPYARRFFAGRDFWTLEPDPALRRYGAAQHVTARLEEIATHFEAGRFDWIVCNGVFGWGLDEREPCERAFRECYARLRPGGRLLLGWNALPEREPFPPETLESLRRFEPETCPPLGSWSVLTRTPYRHRYAFFRRPLA